ncbi:MAG: arsenic efflux protein [Oscillospiraceae bacterium]|nr:arsenic efflux protein [Oscillospiraceae bacterium]
MEALEHHAGSKINKALASSGGAGPLIGALLGCVPQCGFSVFSANLYSGGVIGAGTLLAVFLSTSDEAIIIMLSNPDKKPEILKLIAVKVLIAVIFGYIITLFEKIKPAPKKHMEDLCKECGCEEEDGILKPAIHHTLKIFAFVTVIIFIVNLCVELLGTQRLSSILLSNSIFQPVIAAVLGLVPSCASSIILTQLYLEGAISFASVIAGLCTGAGAGLIVLFRENRNLRENLFITFTLYITAVISGVVIQLIGI